jgi:hypothetical protein
MTVEEILSRYETNLHQTRYVASTFLSLFELGIGSIHRLIIKNNESIYPFIFDKKSGLRSFSCRSDSVSSWVFCQVRHTPYHPQTNGQVETYSTPTRPIFTLLPMIQRLLYPKISDNDDLHWADICRRNRPSPQQNSKERLHDWIKHIDSSIYPLITGSR